MSLVILFHIRFNFLALSTNISYRTKSGVLGRIFSYAVEYHVQTATCVWIFNGNLCFIQANRCVFVDEWIERNNNGIMGSWLLILPVNLLMVIQYVRVILTYILTLKTYSAVHGELETIVSRNNLSDGVVLLDRPHLDLVFFRTCRNDRRSHSTRY